MEDSLAGSGRWRRTIPDDVGAIMSACPNRDPARSALQFTACSFPQGQQDRCTQVPSLRTMIEHTGHPSEKRRYLVFHDAGMSGAWWWIRARSTDEVVLTYANVEVVEDPEWQESASTWPIDDVDIDEPGEDGELLSLRVKRDRQRTQPGFGALAGSLKRPTDVGTSLTEHGPDGRRLRQVDVGAGGKLSRVDRFVLNPPYDLYDPELSPWEISAEEFEEALGNASDQSLS